MNRRPIVYDITRLATRILVDAPNGIDRVDLQLAKHFVFRSHNLTHALLATLAGPRLVSIMVARQVIGDIEEWWQEQDNDDGALYDQVVDLATCVYRKPYLS
jgi:hypothetical protein